MITPLDPVAPFLERQGVLVLDGGLATTLEAHGYDLVDPLWSARVLLEAPDAIRAVHHAFLEAGADCIATATYQATLEGFGRRGLGPDEAVERLLSGVRLAVEVRDAFWADPARRADRLRPMVAASVGPYGAFLADGSEYTGRYDLDEAGLVDFHAPRWALLAASDADLLACETLPSLAEARALLRLLDDTPGRRAWMSFQCRDAGHLADGTPIEVAAELCGAHPGVVAVGVNCVPPARVSGLLARARRATEAPLVAYPNSGEAWDPVAKVWRGDPEGHDQAASAAAWVAAGARLVGGCCRTGPADIARIRGALISPS